MQTDKQVVQPSKGGQETHSRWLKRRKSQPPIGRLQPALVLRCIRANQGKGCWGLSRPAKLPTSLRRGSIHLDKSRPSCVGSKLLVSPLELGAKSLLRDVYQTQDKKNQPLSGTTTKNKTEEGRIEWSTQISSESPMTTQLSSCQLNLFLDQDLSFINHPRPALDAGLVGTAKCPYIVRRRHIAQRQRHQSPLCRDAGSHFDKGCTLKPNEYTPSETESRYHSATPLMLRNAFSIGLPNVRQVRRLDRHYFFSLLSRAL